MGEIFIFWDDKWLDNQNAFSTFPCLYHLSSMKSRLATNVLSHFGTFLLLGFCGPLSIRKTMDVMTLLSLIGEFEIS